MGVARAKGRGGAIDVGMGVVWKRALGKRGEGGDRKGEQVKGVGRGLSIR